MSVSLPFLSVIMPVYNGAHFLAEAMASIRRQNYTPLEIIVIDDGSTDQTAEVVRQQPGEIRYAYQENAGPSAARNKGIGMARGELIAFLDADDLWPEGKLENQVGRLLENPELDVVTGRIQYIHLPGAKMLDLPYEGPHNTVTHVHLGSGVYRRRVFERVGLFDETLRFSEDHDWFLRAREERVSMIILEQVTLLYRLHEGNMTRDRTFHELQLAKVLKKSLDRRRKKGLGQARPLGNWSDFDEVKGTRPHTEEK
jgi:glycosyltransferase involved in cell wall biosynthesis